MWFYFRVWCFINYLALGDERVCILGPAPGGRWLIVSGRIRQRGESQVYPSVMQEALGVRGNVRACQPTIMNSKSSWGSAVFWCLLGWPSSQFSVCTNTIYKINLARNQFRSAPIYPGRIIYVVENTSVYAICPGQLVICTLANSRVSTIRRRQKIRNQVIPGRSLFVQEEIFATKSLLAAVYSPRRQISRTAIVLRTTYTINWPFMSMCKGSSPSNIINFCLFVINKSSNSILAKYTWAICCHKSVLPLIWTQMVCLKRILGHDVDKFALFKKIIPTHVLGMQSYVAIVLDEWLNERLLLRYSWSIVICVRTLCRSSTMRRTQGQLIVCCTRHQKILFGRAVGRISECEPQWIIEHQIIFRESSTKNTSRRHTGFEST